MKARPLGAVVLAIVILSSTAHADEYGQAGGTADTTDHNTVRVVVEKSGGEYRVKRPAASGGSSEPACDYDVLVREHSADPATGRPAGKFVVVLCEGRIVDIHELAEADVVDLDAAAAEEAGRYVDEVVVPNVKIGVNPAAQGLVGLPSWFWIEGWAGSVQAAPISAFGVTIDVRMSSGEVVWDFGDGTRVTGDLGRAYPTESTVRHAYQGPGTFTVTAAIALNAEYRVNGGPWITLPPLTADASTQHSVQERQAVLTER